MACPLLTISQEREIEAVMKQQQRAVPKKLDYPETTAGSRLASKARKLASKLTAEQRREHFNGAMAMIYAAQKERLSLDANFLFDLAEEEDFAHDLLEALQSKGYGLALRPRLRTNYTSFSLAVIAKQNGNWRERTDLLEAMGHPAF